MNIDVDAIEGAAKVMEVEDIHEGYWYEHRHELEPGQIFRSYDGSFVKLDRQVPGDGTRWYVADWHKGFPGTDRFRECKPHWSYEDSTIEPSDLRGAPIAAPPAH